MKKQAKEWTLNKVYRAGRITAAVFSAWEILWCVITAFGPETVKYIGAGMILLGFVFLIVAGSWSLKRWICPHCGQRLGRRDWDFPVYCSHCGEKLDAPIDTK